MPLDNPYAKRRGTHSIGKAGRQSEKLLSKKLGHRPRPASGAMEGAKGDIDLGFALMEAKSTIKDTYRLDLSILAKIAHEARSLGKRPVLSVTFVTEGGAPVRNGEWVVMPLTDFNLLNQKKGDA